MSKKSAKTFNQVEEPDDELYIYIYVCMYITNWYIYLSHILRSRQWSYQILGGASANGRCELWVDKTMQTDHTNYERIQKALKTDQAWKTSKLS